MVEDIHQSAFDEATHALNSTLSHFKHLLIEGVIQTDRALSFSLVCRMYYDVSVSLCRAKRSGMSDAELRDRIAPLRNLIARSAFAQRLQEWPRGYAGDFETIEKLYFSTSESTDDFGRLLDDAAFNFPICQQHRNKIAQQCEEIKRICREKPNPRILIVAAGGAIDAWQARSALERSGATIVFNDIESEALDLVRLRFSGSSVTQHYIPGNMFRKCREFVMHGKYDLILCGGLFDYVEMNSIQSFLRVLFNDAMAHNGAILFTNLADNNPYQDLIETFFSWEMKYRSERDFEVAVHAVFPGATLQHWRDQTKLAVFYRMTKHART